LNTVLHGQRDQLARLSNMQMLLRTMCFLVLVSTLQAETITGYIFCDNYFEFWFNEVKVAVDPLDFTPHNAVKVSFEYDGTSAKTYAIMCQDYASPSGFEYTSTTSPQLGDGNLLAEFSDGVKTSKTWKTWTVTYGPTEASEAAGCSGTNLAACAITDNGTPTDWYKASFDDASWTAATEYTAAEAGWGRTPTYSGGKCGTITSPLTKENAAVSSITTTADECLDPKMVLCGGDGDCTGEDARMLWGASLKKDNKMLYRFTVAAPSGTAAAPSDTTATAAPSGTTDTSASSSASVASATTSATSGSHNSMPKMQMMMSVLPLYALMEYCNF